jgi:hypothetical protein
MRKIGLPFFLLCLSGGQLVHAESDSKIQFQGAQVFTEFGSIVNGVELALDTLDNMWVQRFGGTFDLVASPGDQLKLYFGTGSMFWHAIPVITNQSASKVFYGDAILTKAYMEYRSDEEDAPAFVGKLGFVPVKYSNSRNLGEYLFRTGVYPDYIVTGNGYTAVNTSRALVLGTQITHQVSPSFSHDLFFTSERESYPLHDFSLSYLAKYKSTFVNFGVGLQFSRLISVTPSFTTPNDPKNTWFNHQGEDIVNNPEYYSLLATGAQKKGDAAGAAFWQAKKQVVDSLRTVWETDPTTKPDFGKFTFKGIKPLAMLSLDFKPLFGVGLFSGDEMVLYSEAVLMGWKNYPVYYDNRMNRLAFMAGLNIPTFGLLDVFNVEVERWAEEFVNGYRNAREGSLPIPDYNYDQINGYVPDDLHKDDLKWSVFLSRKIMSGLSIQAQVASDHLRGRRFTRVVSENSLLVDDSHWYYFIKLQASL